MTVDVQTLMSQAGLPTTDLTARRSALPPGVQDLHRRVLLCFAATGNAPSADRRAGPPSPGRVLDRRCCRRPGHGLADVVAGHGGLLRLLPAVRGLPAQPAGAAKNGGRVPLVTVIAVVLGGALLGIVGAVVAVPAAAAVQLVLVEVVYPNRDPADR